MSLAKSWNFDDFRFSIFDFGFDVDFRFEISNFRFAAMNPVSVCPSRGELSAFLSGELAEARLLEIGAHLANCSVCLDAADRCDAEDTARRADTLFSVGPGQLEAAPLLDEPALARMIAAAKDIRVAESAHSAAEQSFSAAPASHQRPPIPASLGQYDLLERIGEGGMGAVYKARHRRLERIVSLKVIAEHRISDREAVDRFVREWVSLARLHDEHIVQAIDADEDGGFHFLVMEFVEGIDLARLVQRGGRLRICDACEIVRQAALGLQFVGDQKLVHRDIKPSNLMVETSGKVKILDLGLALWQSDESAHSGLTVDHQILGTVDYIAPEQAFDSHAVDIRADVYSLGCTLYFLLTGQAPFSGAEYPSTLKKLLAHSQAAPPSAAARRGDVPPRLDALLRRMMAKLPGERPAAGKLARELEPFAAGSDLQRFARGDLIANLGDAAEPARAAAGAGGKHGRRWFAMPHAAFARLAGNSRRTRIGMAVLLLAALIACGGLALNRVFLRGPADPTGPSAEGQAGFSPLSHDAESDGPWQNALSKRPKELLCENRNQSWWMFEHDNSPVSVNSSGRTVLQLGTIAAENYEVLAMLNQNPWNGGIGLFFGCHPAVGGESRLQALCVSPALGPGPSFTTILQLGRRLETISGQRVGSLRVVLAAQRIDNLTSNDRQNHCLRFVVRAGKLAEIWFDNESLSDVLPEPGPNFPPDHQIRREDAVGGFGLYASHGAGTLLECRFRLLKAKQGSTP